MADRVTPLTDLQAERDRLIAALVDNDRAIARELHPGPPRPDCTARDPRGGRYGRAPVKGDTR